MLDKLKGLLKGLANRLAVPAAALGAIGVSTTLACCYGPPPDYPVEDYETVDACETMLRECAKAHGLWSDECDSGSMKSCTLTVAERATQAWNKSLVSEDSLKTFILKQLEQKEITTIAALETLLLPWKNCTPNTTELPSSCQYSDSLYSVADILENAQFNDRQVRLVAAKNLLSYHTLDAGLHARGYELYAAAIAADTTIDPSVPKVLELLAAETRIYALYSGISVLGPAIAEVCKRAGDTATLETLTAIATKAAENENADVREAANALLTQISQTQSP